jgi:hypothetical protein
MSRKFGPERSLIELYIIIFLNKLKIVQNKKMKKINKTKRLWLRLWGTSEIHKPLLGSLGHGPMYRLNPPLICPVIRKSKQSLNGTHRVTFVTNPVISHERWKQDGIMMKTAVALLFHNRWFWYHSKYFVRYFYRIFLWQKLKLHLLKYVIITYFHFKHISKHLMEIQNF